MSVMVYTSMARPALISVGLKRGILYSHIMNRPQLISMLEKNDADSSIVLDLDVQAKKTEYQKRWLSKNRESYNKYHREYITNKIKKKSEILQQVS